MWDNKLDKASLSPSTNIESEDEGDEKKPAAIDEIETDSGNHDDYMAHQAANNDSHEAFSGFSKPSTGDRSSVLELTMDDSRSNTNASSPRQMLGPRLLGGDSNVVDPTLLQVIAHQRQQQMMLSQFHLLRQFRGDGLVQGPAAFPVAFHPGSSQSSTVPSQAAFPGTFHPHSPPPPWDQGGNRSHEHGGPFTSPYSSGTEARGMDTSLSASLPRSPHQQDLQQQLMLMNQLQRLQYTTVSDIQHGVALPPPQQDYQPLRNSENPTIRNHVLPQVQPLAAASRSSSEASTTTGSPCNPNHSLANLTKPRRALNAYNCFSIMGKEISRRWRLLQTANRQRYRSLAEQDQRRYEAEMEEYQRAKEEHMTQLVAQQREQISDDAYQAYVNREGQPKSPKRKYKKG